MTSTKRIESLDLLKGAIMVLMALDHTRDFFFYSPSLAILTDPTQTTVPVFFTRWITHFCAPAFSLLAGVSVYIVSKKKTPFELSIFLLKRGIWLMALELTVITFGWYFDVEFHNMDVAVIWVLGLSMVILAGLIHIPRIPLMIFSIIVIAGHNLLDSIHFDGILWSLLHEENSFAWSTNFMINVAYPITPWFAVMSLGFTMGPIYSSTFDGTQRRKLLNILGIFGIILFVVIRYSNLYGNLWPWTVGATTQQTIFSFLNVTKYPPSLLYLMFTLSGIFLILANSENWRGKVVDFFSVYGRVPFFYYILHLYLIHVLAMVAAQATGHGWQTLILYTYDIDLGTFGFELWATYLIWVGIILVLYLPCKWFDTYKRNHKEKWWLSYL